MNAVRKIIENSSNPLCISLPKEYENKKLEVIVMTIDEDQNLNTNALIDLLYVNYLIANMLENSCR